MDITTRFRPILFFARARKERFVSCQKKDPMGDSETNQRAKPESKGRKLSRNPKGRKEQVLSQLEPIPDAEALLKPDLKLQYRQTLQEICCYKKAKKQSCSSKHKPPCYQTSISLNLPENLTVSYIERHKLSRSDLDKLLHGVQTHHYLLCVVSQGIDLQSSNLLQRADDTEHRSAFTPVCTSGFKNLNELNARFRRCTAGSHSHTDKLVCPFDDHSPPLPVHYASQTTIDRLVQFLPNSLKFPSYTLVFSWMDIHVVPIDTYHGYLMMQRVILLSDYEALHGSGAQLHIPEELPHVPQYCFIGGQTFVLSQDRFLIQTCETHTYLKTRSKEFVVSLQHVCKSQPTSTRAK